MLFNPNIKETGTQSPPADFSSDSQALERLLLQRFSCRGFLGAPVPQDALATILRMAQRTASWCNAQPWEVIVTRGVATERFREVMSAAAASGATAAPDLPWPREYRGVYQQRRRETGLALYESVGIAKGDRVASARQGLENFRLFGAPHVAIVTTDEALGIYGAVDCGAYVANFMLAAQSMGVASIAQAALASYGPIVHDHFGIPADRQIVCGISFGYADSSHPANKFRTIRADLEHTVRWVD